MDTALELEDDIAFVEHNGTISDYELERGKPMPNRIHSLTQTNIIVALVLRYKKR
jgi:hypothetical protein